MSFNYYIDTGFALAAAVWSWFLGGFDGLMKVLIVLVAVDYVTGILKGYVFKNFSSDIGFHGIAKKVCMFLIIGVANIINHEMLGDSEALRDGIIMFFTANEGLSITENAIALGIPFPETLKERFLSWRNGQSSSREAPKSKKI